MSSPPLHNVVINIEMFEFVICLFYQVIRTGVYATYFISY